MAEEKVNKKKSSKKKSQPMKPYIHIDTFLQTASQMFNLTHMQERGFKVYMKGKHYQRDEKVFLKELKKYLNIK